MRPRRPEVEQFTAEVRDYGAELEDWLASYFEFRAEAVRQFPLTFRIENDGEAPAQNVRLRVRLPKGFRQLNGAPEIAGPPDEPRFKGRFDLDYARPLQSSALRDIYRSVTKEAPAGPVATASYEDDHLVLTYDIGHLNHGPDHMRTDLVVLLAPADGEFEASWEALSANAGPAAKGTLKITVSPAEEVKPPITTMAEITEDTKQHRFAFEIED
jgi:hypothetical protein